MDCNIIKKLLSAYAGGELDTQEKVIVQDHLKHCQRCWKSWKISAICKHPYLLKYRPEKWLESA